jgi:hypothetical protein
MKNSPFPYSYWAKILGVIIVCGGIIALFTPKHEFITISWGLVFIFFSKEKRDDEMVQSLKFKALTVAVIVAFGFTHLYNYAFLNKGNEILLSISAYQFLTLTLTIAIGYFYFLRYQATLK